MHSEHLRQVARDIRASPSYDQSVFFEDDDCNAPGCIAWFAARRAPKKRKRGLSAEGKILFAATDYLKLTESEADDLFYESPSEDEWGGFGTRFQAANSPTEEQEIAAEYLDHLADLAEEKRE